MEKFVETLKTAASVVFLLFLAALVVFGYLGELFPRMIPQWYNDYIAVPLLIVFLIAAFVVCIKFRKGKH